MTRHLDIMLDERDDQAIFEAILARSSGYVPEWKPTDDSAGAGLARIASRYLHAILQRLNQAPEKNRLAFLDLMGEQLVPAQAARVPIVFQLSPDAAGGTAPGGTAVAAPPPPGGNTQIVFETERALGVAPGKLAQVVSLWPGRDEYIDHSAAFLEGNAIRLFDKRLRRLVPHHLYLAHDRLLALAGSVELFVDFDLSQPSAEHLDILWEYWDGELWREFLNMNPACTTETQEKLDGTNGLTRSGRYILQADCAASAKTEVAGVAACWIRGRLTEPLPVEPEKRLPEVRTIRLSSAVNQPLQPRLAASEPYPPLDGSHGAAPFRVFGLIQSEASLPLVDAVVRLTERDNPTNVYTAQASDSDGLYEIDDVAAECGSAWNKDPASGVIGVQSGPP